MTGRMNDTSKSDIEANSKQLSELSRFVKYGYIDIPHDLKSFDVDHKKVYDEVLEPQWNQVVSVLDQGRGYGNLLTMIGRLQEKLKIYEDRYQKEEKLLNRFQMAFDLFGYEANEYGLDARVGESLGKTKPKASYPDWWNWKVMLTGSGMGNKPLTVKHIYIPQLTRVFMQTYNADKIPDFVTPVKGEDTWREVIEKTERRGKMHEDLAQNYQRVVEIIKFRIEVIEAVLHEYEILGTVGAYEPSQFEQEKSRSPKSLSNLLRLAWPCITNNQIPIQAEKI